MKKNFFPYNQRLFLMLLLSCFLLVRESYSQAVFTPTKTIRTVYITTDFGATNNGDVDDDTWAFIKAGKYISNRWAASGAILPAGTQNYNPVSERIRLIIPLGTYRVGKQLNRNLMGNCAIQTNINYKDIFPTIPTLPLGQNYANITVYANGGKWFGLDLILLDNFTTGVEVEIIGETDENNSKPLIKYNPLHIGYFNCDGTARTVTGGNAFDGDIGHFVEAIGYRNLMIKNIEIDGNNVPGSMPNLTTTEYKGNFFSGHNEGIQVGGDGIILGNTKNATIEDMYIHHMTREGIQVNDAYFSPADDNNPAALMNLVISRTTCDNNRRNAFSWGGGRGLTVVDSKFNNTGQTVINSIEGAANTNPGAGIDIELLDADVSKRVMDATFTNCEAINNIGWALVNGPGWERTRNLNFTGCKFHDVSGFCVVVRGNAITFNNCSIWGAIDDCNTTGISGNETKFYNCKFEDVAIQGEDNVSTPNDLINLDGGARKTLFSGCEFKVNSNIRMMFINVPPISPATITNEADFTIFNNCKFIYKSTHVQGGIDQFFGCLFNGINTIENQNTANKLSINAKGIVFKGSQNVCAPNSFTIKGRTAFTYANSHGGYSDLYLMGRDNLGGSAGYFDFNIEPESLLFNYNGTKVKIGSNTTLRNKTGGQMMSYGASALSNTIITNEGKIVLEDGSYTMFPGYTTTYLNGTTNANGVITSEFYYHKNAHNKLNSTWVSDFNFPTNENAFPFQNINLTNTIFDGGNGFITNAGLLAITPVNEAVELNGEDQSIKIPGTVSKGGWLPSKPLAIEIAFKRSNTLIDGYLFSQPGGIQIRINGSQLQFYGWVVPGSILPVPLYSIPLPSSDLSCHYLTFTKFSAANRVNIYLDGNLVSSPISISNAIHFNTSQVTLGISSGGTYNQASNNAFFSGWIGQLRLWSRELTQDDVCNNYKKKTPLNSTGLMGDWDMTETTGSAILNISNPGILTNGILVNNPSRVSQALIGDCNSTAGTNNAFNNFRPLANNQSATIHSLASDFNKLVLYPNPNNGAFELQFKNTNKTGSQVLTIYNAEGKMIYNKTVALLNGISQKINLENIADGVYILKLNDGKDAYTKKIIINR